ncbi:HAD hydrolase family protein [Candidatus Pacearchaeota archaeon]|nr:HAD hydrolase family protein [Candidatus Pacearchaeota archaeon]
MKIKLISLDVDGCLVAYKNIRSRFESSWDALGCAYGLKDRWDKRIDKFYGRKNSDLEWANQDTADLINLPVKTAEKFLFPLPYSPGAREFARASKGKLLRGLLTTSIDLVAEKAQEELELDFSFCNVLNRNNGFFTGTLDYNVPIWRKHKKIGEICRQYSIIPEEICHVGDNENDISVGRKVGLFIAFNPKKEEVANNAKHVIHDFRELIKIFGF